jgi:hypothetical protein
MLRDEGRREVDIFLTEHGDALGHPLLRARGASPHPVQRPCHSPQALWRDETDVAAR